MDCRKYYLHAKLYAVLDDMMDAIVAQNTCGYPLQNALHCDLDEHDRPVKWYVYVWPSKLEYNLDHAFIDYMESIEEASKKLERYNELMAAVAAQKLNLEVEDT